MPYKEHQIEKKYYTIGEIASIFKVNTSLIRFWEQEFDIIKPSKNKKGNRQYTKDDLESVKLVYSLVKEKGFTLQGAKDKIKEKRNLLQNNMEMVESLEKVKSFLIDLKNRLD